MNQITNESDLRDTHNFGGIIDLIEHLDRTHENDNMELE